ncbi:MAG: hypothetical protein COA42_00610 [Alteromonadaceae bacterium]|nr:MAG: hypothetical protein COA42_00610 [Alteromonadaceae bacterium]
MAIAWILIILAAAMVLGPVLLIQPSKGAAKTAKIRELAALAGLRVSVLSKDDAKRDKNKDGLQSEARDYVEYSQRLPRTFEDIYQGDSCWSLTRCNYTHGLHFHSLWDWGGEARPNTRLEAALKTFIDQLPEGVSSLILRDDYCALHWNEVCIEQSPEDAVAGIQQLLVAFVSILTFTEGSTT